MAYDERYYLLIQFLNETMKFLSLCFFFIISHTIKWRRPILCRWTTSHGINPLTDKKTCLQKKFTSTEIPHILLCQNFHHSNSLTAQEMFHPTATHVPLVNQPLDHNQCVLQDVKLKDRVTGEWVDVTIH